MLNEQISRNLASNSLDARNEAIRLLIKIVDNVLKDPKNVKVRTLPKHNPLIINKIISTKGAVDCLKLMGFVEKENSFQLPESVPTNKLKEVREDLLKWNSATNIERPNEDIPIKRIILPPLTKISNNPFLQRIEECFHQALVYDDKNLQQRARNLIPLATLEEKAQSNLRKIQEQIKKRKISESEICIQDMLLLELLAWFKEDFFTWVNSPDCDKCGKETKFSHMSNDPKLLLYTNRVEMHKCSSCNDFTPFARYNDLNILLETRKGRCGEWANVFTLFCCAMKWDARHVIDEGDHVWTEVYSIAQKRWLHCDPCENICDQPLIYETGWNKIITYVIAYSAEEVQDVTWRYTSKHKETLTKRTKCSEFDLVNHLIKLRKKRQENYTNSRKQYLTKRLLNELVELMIEKKPSSEDNSGRISGSLEWRTIRGETQMENNDNRSHVFLFKDDEIAKNKAGNILIKYSCALDKYELFLGTCKVKEINNWDMGVFHKDNIFRKVENDWKMVYLCRKVGSKSGEISWKFQLESKINVIDTIELKLWSKTFENGNIQVNIKSDDLSINFPTEIGQMKSFDFSGKQEFIVTASLFGGKGDVAWQHTQLFRQKLDNNEFELTLNVHIRKIQN